MLKRILYVLLLVGAPVVVSADIKVGVLAAFSGDWAAYGSAYRRGIELAHIPSSITFIYEDDQFLPAKTVAAFNKLVEIDKVAAVLIGDTVTAQAVAPIAKKKQIPILVWASEDRLFSDNPYVLRLWSSTAVDFAATRNLITSKGYKRIAVFTSAHSYATSWGESVRSLGDKNTLQNFTTDPSSFQPYIVKLKNAGIDAVALCLNSGVNGLFIRQLRQLGMTFPVIACNFVESSADVSTAGDAMDGTIFTAPRISAQFWKEYRDRFGETDHIFSAAIFYDAAMILRAAFVEQGLNSLLIDRIISANPIDTALSKQRIVVNDMDRHLGMEFGAFSFKNKTIHELVN